MVDVIIQNQGLGYLAPPRIDFLGDGAGATAYAEISDSGAVTNIVITNPGSGYWPLPNVGYNPAAVPTIPSQQGAVVLITTGYITNLLYR